MTKKEKHTAKLSIVLVVGLVVVAWFLTYLPGAIVWHSPEPKITFKEYVSEGKMIRKILPQSTLVLAEKPDVEELTGKRCIGYLNSPQCADLALFKVKERMFAWDSTTQGYYPIENVALQQTLNDCYEEYLKYIETNYDSHNK